MAKKKNDTFTFGFTFKGKAYGKDLDMGCVWDDSSTIDEVFTRTSFIEDVVSNVMAKTITGKSFIDRAHEHAEKELNDMMDPEKREAILEGISNKE